MGNKVQVVGRRRIGLLVAWTDMAAPTAARLDQASTLEDFPGCAGRWPPPVGVATPPIRQQFPRPPARMLETQQAVVGVRDDYASLESAVRLDLDRWAGVPVEKKKRQRTER